MMRSGIRLKFAHYIAIAAIGCAPAATGPEPSASVPVHDRVTEASAAPAAEKSEPPTELRTRIESAVEHVRRRDLLTTNAFWTVFHGMLAFGPGLALRDPATNEHVNALDYISTGAFERGEIRGLRFLPTASGLDVQMGPVHVGQGHQDQFIGEIAQWGIAPDQVFVVLGKPYTLMDFVKHSQANARVGQELSWTIIVLGQYLGTDIEWTNRFGEKLHYEDLIRSELEASVDEAACGGTHRLFGLNWSLHLHKRSGGAVTGAWLDVEAKLKQYAELARKYQNPDGTFSTNYFRGPGSDRDIQTRINSTGHILEWLAQTLDDTELRSPWMESAANALSLLFLEAQATPLESGGLYHATHGLVVYHHRVFGESAVSAEKATVRAEPNP